MSLISFVIPALDEETLIAKCILSIRAEAPGSPIIVVDNGSSDRTVEIASDLPGVIVVKEPRRGITIARQRGLELATTKWVAFIDADNTLPDGWYLEAMRVLHGKNVVAASGPPQYHELLVLARMMVFAFYCVGKIIHLAGLPMIQGGGFIVDREKMLEAGGFDLGVDFYGEDTITARRLAKFGKIKFDLDLYFLSSNRRIAAEGLVRTGTRYAMNYAWVWITGRPWTSTHTDHRDAA